MTISEALILAGTKYKKELLAAPVIAFDELRPHFNIQTGLQGKIVGGILSAEAEFRPYRTEKGASDIGAITPHEWEVFLGDVVKEFDPHRIMGSLYTEPTNSKPDQMKIAARVAVEMSKKAGEKLYDNLFTAEHNSAGNTSADLFNGFSTIFAAAITADKASENIGNYMDFSGKPIGAHNAGDALKSMFKNLNRVLTRGKKLSLYCPPSIVDYYEEWYQQEFGHVPWNQSYQQKELHSSRGKLKFVELDNMEAQNFMFVSVRENMNIGFDNESDKEEVEIRRVDNPKVVQLFMKTHFGTGFETIMPEYLCGIKFEHYAPEAPEEPSNE
jgi:hypothetical protein